jgi:hypothetical protein
MVVRLTATPLPAARFDHWSSSACSGSSATCVVRMDQDHQANAHFTLLRFGANATEPGPSILRVRSTLGVHGGRGEISVNGSTSQVREGEANVVGAEQSGDNQVDARLLEANGEGFWRFDVSGSEPLAPGTLRVLAGELAGVAAGSVVFRLSGRAGERVAFAWTPVRAEVGTLP